MAIVRLCYDTIRGFIRLVPGCPVNASVCVQIDPRGVLALDEMKTLNNDAKVETLSLERTNLNGEAARDLLLDAVWSEPEARHLSLHRSVRLIYI